MNNQHWINLKFIDFEYKNIEYLIRIWYDKWYEFNILTDVKLKSTLFNQF